MTVVEIEERRRLELDLHDRAQEPLAVAALTLRRAAAHARGTAAERLVRQAYDQLQSGLAELRDVARGIHPYALSTYGLATALEGLTARATLPIELDVTRERLQPVVEAALYFTVAEAVEHFAEHAEATQATVTVFRAGDSAVAEIAADGPEPAGARLRGSAVRVEALSGRLEVESSSGAATRIRAVIPL